MKNKKAFSRAIVTGGAGFVGSHLVEALVSAGTAVTVLDNLSSGSMDFISKMEKRENFSFEELDVLDSKALKSSIHVCEPQVVFHLAANPNASIGADSKRTHLDSNLIGTYNVLEAVAGSGARSFVLASTSTVYGNAKIVPTPETAPLEPVSLYGASKLAGESFACAFGENYGLACSAMRYANIVGPRLTHGALYDFVQRLRRTPARLEVLGDGRQNKSYVHVSDAVSATLLAAQKNPRFFESYNVGTSDSASVRQIAQMAVDRVSPKAKIVYKGGQAWKGDVVKMGLDCSKINKLGWKPKFNSLQALEKMLESL